MTEGGVCLRWHHVYLQSTLVYLETLIYFTKLHLTRISVIIIIITMKNSLRTYLSGTCMILDNTKHIEYI